MFELTWGPGLQTLRSNTMGSCYEIVSCKKRVQNVPEGAQVPKWRSLLLNFALGPSNSKTGSFGCCVHPVEAHIDFPSSKANQEMEACIASSMLCPLFIKGSLGEKLPSYGN